MSDSLGRRLGGIAASLIGMFMLVMAGVCLSTSQWFFMCSDIFVALVFFAIRNVLWWHNT